MSTVSCSIQTENKLPCLFSIVKIRWHPDLCICSCLPFYRRFHYFLVNPNFKIPQVFDKHMLGGYCSILKPMTTSSGRFKSILVYTFALESRHGKSACHERQEELLSEQKNYCHKRRTHRKDNGWHMWSDHFCSLRMTMPSSHHGTILQAWGFWIYDWKKTSCSVADQKQEPDSLVNTFCRSPECGMGGRRKYELDLTARLKQHYSGITKQNIARVLSGFTSETLLISKISDVEVWWSM